jgi:hypothetical protein
MSFSILFWINNIQHWEIIEKVVVIKYVYLLTSFTLKIIHVYISIIGHTWVQDYMTETLYSNSVMDLICGRVLKALCLTMDDFITCNLFRYILGL